MLQQYLISIDARLRLRNSTVSVKVETQLSRDANIKETFQIHFLIYFSDSGRFLCVNAYFGASIYLTLFFVQIMVNKTKKKCGIYKRHFLYAQLKFVSLK